MVALSRNVARKHAMEMLLTGDMISAEDARASASSTAWSRPARERDEALDARAADRREIRA